MRSLRLLAAALLVASVLSGCAPTDVTVTVTPDAATYDEPVTVTATGLHGGEAVTLRLTTRDTKGVTWRSTVTTKADGAGRLRHRAVDLLSRLAPSSGPARYFERPSGWTMRVDVLDGDDDLAHRSFRRLDPRTDHLVTETKLMLPGGQVYGALFEPVAPPPAPTSGVVAFGGSEGGISGIGAATLLAAHGHPAMAIGYFGVPGLPDHLARIPLEFFADAVRRLAQAPGVDPQRITLFGVSRGSEAAVLTALDFPGLVHSVVAGVPNSLVGPGLPDDAQPAWTLGGATVPLGLLSVERFPGKVLLACGTLDHVWDSCGNSRILKDQDPDRVTALPYDGAGHLVGSLTPGIPDTESTGKVDGFSLTYGGTPSADMRGRFDAWPRVLAFLEH